MEQRPENVHATNARLVQIREALGLNQEAFAALLNISRPYLSNIEKGRNKVAFEIVTFLIEAKGISAHWFHTGEGDMFTNPNTPKGHVNGHVNGHATPTSKTKGTKNTHASEEVAPPYTAVHRTFPQQSVPSRMEILFNLPDVGENRVVPMVNRKAAATYLTGYQTQEYYEELDVMTVPAWMMRGPSQGLIIQAINDSMEDTIFEGDYLLCRYIEPAQWLEINDFTVCVIVTESRGIQVKRIKNRLKKDGLLRLSSDNRQYQSFNVFPDDIHQIWQVSFLLTANLPNRGDTLYRKLDTLEDATTDIRELYEQMRQELDELRPKSKKKPH